MTTSRQLEISLAGGRSGSGPATWGQRAIWDIVNRLAPGDRPRFNIATSAPIDPGLPLPVVLDALGHLLHLHDSLHTRLLPAPDGAGVHQIVDPDGRLPVHVRDCPDGADRAELTAAGEALHAELAARPFDVGAEWPIRVGLVVADGLVRQMSLTLSHTAVDGTGMGLLVRDLSELALGADPAAIRAARAPQQPLEEAGFQTSPRGLKRDANARAHALRKLRGAPARLFPPAVGKTGETGTAATEAGAERFPNAVLDSPALLRAVDAVAAAHRTGTSAVLLAATAAMTARLSGSPDAVLQVVVNNRFLSGLSDAVSVVAGDALLHLPNADVDTAPDTAPDSDDARDFGAAVRRTHAASIAAYRHAYFDRRLLDAEVARLTAEGVPLADRSCVFNDTRELLPAGLTGPADDAPATAPDGRTTLSWPVEFDPRPGLSYALDALRTPDTLRLAMTADPSVLPRPAMERFLYGIEELVLTEERTLNGLNGPNGLNG
ncbi:non-ribosomal peptide synthetase condensation domain protein [Kitasatospora sp. NPDC093806]|uniref:non-ribosomal peptide synthetase condensation domain protein n=1 Tax=Kitasatospora sp. NPDC093806 TaxID=3155075 RepID=UPI00342F2C31